MRPTWGPSGADRTQVGPMLASWTLLSGISVFVPEFEDYEKVTLGTHVGMVYEGTEAKYIYPNVNGIVLCIDFVLTQALMYYDRLW